MIFLQKDVTHPWKYKGYFDGIFTSFGLREIPEEERLGVLEKSYFALKERGRMVIADFNPQISGVRKIVLFTFFKLFERENLNFLSFYQNEILRKVRFKEIETFLILFGLFQITLAQKN